MSQSWIFVGLLVAGIACLPYLLRMLQARNGSLDRPERKSQLVSVLAVGPQQRVVTVKVSSNDKVATLVLGVTPGSVNCLHKWETVDASGTVQKSVSNEALRNYVP